MLAASAAAPVHLLPLFLKYDKAGHSSLLFSLSLSRRDHRWSVASSSGDFYRSWHLDTLAVVVRRWWSCGNIGKDSRRRSALSYFLFLSIHFYRSTFWNGEPIPYTGTDRLTSAST